jgi:hypothetical protein
LLRLELALSISVPVETEQTNKTALVGGSRVNNAHWTQKIWDPYCVLRFWLSSVEDGVLAGSPLAIAKT